MKKTIFTLLITSALITQTQAFASDTECTVKITRNPIRFARFEDNTYEKIQKKIIRILERKNYKVTESDSAAATLTYQVGVGTPCGTPGRDGSVYTYGHSVLQFNGFDAKIEQSISDETEIALTGGRIRSWKLERRMIHLIYQSLESIPSCVEYR